MEQLANKSGVSSKTISLYEQTPPKRPSRKVVGRLSQALDISPDILLEAIGSKGRSKKGGLKEIFGMAIELSDIQVVRILGLVEKEIQDLQYLMIETASLADEHPSLARSVEYLAADIDLLTGIKQRFS
jgi:transcriptional regulator with XRE-family HTH domain